MTKKFLNNFFNNLVSSFSGYNYLFHILFIVITYFLVISGFDWLYFESTRNHILQQIALFPAIIGFIVPILLPLGIYIYARVKKSHKDYLIMEAVIQAGIIGYLLSITYKAFTGRIQPEFLTFNSIIDISREFNFGFLKHGVFWGWPSSHTAVAFAMSFALIAFYPGNKKIKYLAIIYAFFIGIGVSISIHWFSDFVAGAILGALVGTVVGRNYSRAL